MSRPLTALVLVAVWLAASAVRADEPAGPGTEEPDRARARELTREGAELFRAGNRRAAVVKFEEAYALYPTPALLYNLGKAYAGLSDEVRAHRALSRFLRESTGDDVDDARRDEVGALLVELEAEVSVLTIRATAHEGARIEIDGEAVGVAPLPDAIAVAPGVHEITARRERTLVARKRASFAVGTRAVVELIRIEDDLEKIFVTREVESRPIYKRWWFWTAVGVTAVSTAAVIIAANPRQVNEVADPPLGDFDLEDFGQ